MEPAQLSLGVVTRPQRETFACAVGGNARVLLADVSHPGEVKVLTLDKDKRQSVILPAAKSYKCTHGPSVTSSFIIYGGLAFVLNSKLFVFSSQSGLG